MTMLKTTPPSQQAHNKETNLPIRSYTTILGDKVRVTEDKKSKSRIINFPFNFPDGTNGVMIILRLKDEEWVPNQSINRVTVEFK